MRTTILLSGGGTTFAAIEAATNERVAITHVISDNPDAYGLERAHQRSITTHCVPYSTFASRPAFDAALLEAVERTDPDLVVLAGFMRIVSPDFVRAFDGRLLNIHPSLLPLYPGLDTYARALADQRSEHGSTVHFVNDVLDGGPLIAQAVVTVENDDTPASLSTRVQRAERVLYPTVIDWFAHGRLRQKEGRAWLDDVALDVPLRGRVDEQTNSWIRDD